MALGRLVRSEAWEARCGVDAKLEIWRDALEFKGFRLSMSKTEYMK